MRQFILQSILVAAVAQAAPTAKLQTANSSESAVLYFRFGLEDGFEKEMAISYQNVTSAPATLKLEMVNAKGTVIAVPYRSTLGGITNLTHITTEVQPYAAGIYATEAKSSAFRHGWLRVTSTPANAVSVSVHARYKRSDEGEQHHYTLQAVRPSVNQLIGPFDNGSRDHYLFANTGSENDMVTLIARTREGVEVCRGATTIRPGEFYKEEIRRLLPCTAGQRGMLEVRSTNGTTAAMVFVLPSGGDTIPLHPAAVQTSQSVDDQVREILARIRRSIGLN